MKVINPATGDIIQELEQDSSESVEEKFKALKKGQRNWAQKTVKHRVSCIVEFKNQLNDQIESLSAILTKEVGKPISQSRNEIKGAINRINYFIQNSEEVLKEKTVFEDEQLVERVVYEPLGVIANISAWNYPYLVGVNVIIPALIGGNAVIYKPSEFSSLTGLEIEKLMHGAGIPENVFRAVLGTGEVGQYVLDLPLDGYFFTGSYRTGNYILEEVSKKMVPCQMELGGKDPLYVSENNTNISQVAKQVAEGAFYNNGQSCCAVERVYVHEKVYKEFVDSFVSEVKSYSIGNPNEEVFIGPLTRKDQIEVLERQVSDAVNKGANLLVGGKKMDLPGYYFEPTVFVDVNHEMLVMKEESFGPIIGIQKVSTASEALELMGDTDYGLTSSIFTNNENEFHDMAQKMNTGSVYWNCCDRVSANLPWSGRKNSGIGSTLSEEGIRAFVQPKALHMKR